jgi:uncharacterized membrane protein
MKEKPINSNRLKAISWHVIEAISLFVIALFVTHSSSIALSIIVIQSIAKIVLRYLHQKIWAKIKNGNSKENPEFEI